MNALVKAGSPGMLQNISARYDMDPEEFRTTIARTVMPSTSTQEEFIAFLMVCNTYELNPILREIYAFPKKGGGIVPIVSIDGWIKLVNQHPRFEGAEWEAHLDEGGKLVAYTCRMTRDDRKMPIVITEYLSECVRPTDPWKMPHRMLRHKAFIQCARYAFGFAGIYDEDEGASIADLGEGRLKPTPKPPKINDGTKDTFDGKGASSDVEDATVTEITKTETAAAEPETTKPSETKPEPEKKADTPKPSRKPNGWAALFEEAFTVIEEGFITKNVAEENRVGSTTTEEEDASLADLILQDGKITKNVVRLRADKRLLEKFRAAFDNCESRDSLNAAAQANETAYKAMDPKGEAKAEADKLFRAAEARIIAADAEAAKQDPLSKEEREQPAGDDDFPGDRKSTTATVDPGKALDPAKMNGAEYIAYCQGYIADATDKAGLKGLWLNQGSIRTDLKAEGEITQAQSDALRAAYQDKLETLA